MIIAKKLLRDYLILVGIPLVIVLAILKFGEHIQAALAIDGPWVMQTDLPPDASPCADALASFEGRNLVISQSGRYLTAIWDHEPRTKFYGSLRDRAFSLSSLASTSKTGCGASALLLEGRIVDGNGARSLEARLRLPDCGGCGELALYSSPRSIGRRAVPVRGYH